MSCLLAVPYGPHGTETLDIFGPSPAPSSAPSPTRGRRAAPALVYIHGGYWRALDKRDQSFVAEPFVQAGALVVLPNYALAPAVSVRHIVLQTVRAVAWVHRHISRHGGDPGRIVVAGHSAQDAYDAAWSEVVAGRTGADMPVEGFAAAPDGTVTVTVRRSVPTLVLRHVPRSEGWLTVSATSVHTRE